MPNKDLENRIELMNSARLFKWLSWIVAAASAYFLAVLSIYFLFFGFHGLSSSQEHWGQFGDFLGGAVNPLMSFLALVAIILTVILQSKQIELSKDELALSRQELTATREELAQSRAAAQEQVAHLKAEAKKTDVYRTIQVLESRLEGLYREPIYFLAGGVLRKRELYFVLTFASQDALRQIIPPHIPPPSEHETELVQTKSLLMHLHLTIVKLSVQLTFLIQFSDSDPVLFFYEPTISHLAGKLKEIGYLPEDDEATLRINSEMRRKIIEGRRGNF
ncbi:MAG TPA: hypothetical protein VMS38_25250 [Pseudorhodoferax sp.]|nr:hypothetical protein [Pseudorhodoferax sp.]